ncbi:MAG: hypothetical protein LKF31_08510 [Muribaculaceae bacterium]|jgi:hypothetical protein|nr:hypothetical protein [Muribaculaceae bacterium]
MMAVLITILIVVVALFIFACYKTDWKTIDEQNQQFYVDGYHLYYDRKILRQKEVERLKQKEL